MADSLVSSGLVALVATSLLFLPACDPAVGDSDGSSSTSGGPSTSTTEPQTSGPPMTSTSTSTSGPPMTSSTTDTPTGSSSSSTSDTGSSSSTGVEGDCVDEDIGSAVGSGLASGTNEDQGDDFQLRYCDGGASTSSTSAGTDPSESGPTGGVGTTGAADTGDFGTTGGTGDFGDGDDYVISWTPPAAGLYVIDTFGSDIDTVLSVVPPECGASSTVCNDDCSDLQSGLVYEASDGETVYIVVEGYGGRRGSFVLNITESSELECDDYGTSTGGGTTTVGTVGTSAGTSPTGA